MGRAGRMGKMYDVILVRWNRNLLKREVSFSVGV